MPAYPHKKQKTIKYSQAPSGEINIEKWIPPFVSNDTGFGYVGVVAEDVGTGKLQCSECGNWFEQLPSHYAVKHDMTGKQYKKKFGLLTGTALKSKRIRLIQSKTISKLQKEGKMGVGNNLGKSPFVKGNKHAANRKGKPKAIESQNAFGVCDLQIMTKIIDLAKKLGKTPTLVDIKDVYGGGLISIMHYRYRSYISYCREYLKMEPGFSNHNPKFLSNKSWRDHLISVGLKSLKEGNPMTIKKLLPPNEQRYVYNHFKSFKHYKRELLAAE